MAEVVATLSVEQCFQRCPCRQRYRQLGPPSLLRLTTAVLTATRSKGVDRMPPQMADCPRNAMQNEGRGVCRLAEDRQPRNVPGGELGSPNSLISRWQHDIDSNRNSGAARSVVTRRCCLCDRQLLESRSPRRVASADRRWRWPGGCLSREPEVHTAVADGQITQFRTEAKSPENDERSTTRGIIAWRGGRCK